MSWLGRLAIDSFVKGKKLQGWSYSMMLHYFEFEKHPYLKEEVEYFKTRYSMEVKKE